MNELIVKNVDIFGDAITAAKDEDGNIFAGVNYFCNALGMSRIQKDTQVDKIRTDKTLSRGYRKFPVGVFDPNNEVVGIRLDFIPIWLAKITITKRMEQDHPELSDKLLQYQLKAKDILAEAFLPTPHYPALALENPEGTVIKLYTNDQWGIMDMGGDLYNLTPSEIRMVNRLLPDLINNGVTQIPMVLCVLLRLFGDDCKLKYVGEHVCRGVKKGE